MKNKKEINVLDELSKGCCMGMDAIYFIMDKVEDDSLKEDNKEENSELFPGMNEMMDDLTIRK